MTEFYKMMIRLIDRSSKKVARSELSVLKYELQVAIIFDQDHRESLPLQSHLWIMKEACDWFVGRNTEINIIHQYITSNSNKCFVVYGGPGSGKTYMLSRVVGEVRGWLGAESPVVCARILGTSPDSSSLQPLLLSVCKQICYNLDMPYEDIPHDLVPLKTYFKQVEKWLIQLF